VGQLGQSTVMHGMVRHFLVRPCCVARGSVERCFVWYGKVLLRRCTAWSCDVLFGGAGFIGVQYGKV